MSGLEHDLGGCRLCADRFARTATAHEPRPMLWFRPRPRLLILGQAPGARVHASGRPYTDPSGVRLRDWLGLDETAFYDRDRVSIIPMAFCFPGYDAKGSDLPPPPVCARTWREAVLSHVGEAPLTLLIGSYAQNWHLGRGQSVHDRVQGWRDHFPRVMPLPHPSWRNTAWLKRNPWFAEELLPALRDRVAEVMNG